MYTESGTERGSQRERVFAELKHRLLGGEFPLGARLVEERLGAILETSRTPVREALVRLHTEGLVVRHSDGGFVPMVPDVATMRTLYEVRVGLEMQALRRPASFGTTHDQEQLVALREEWEVIGAEVPVAAPDFVLLDEAFHVGLAEAAGNGVLVEFLGAVNDRIRIVRMQDFLTADRVSETVEQHLAIVDAVLEGEIELAVALFDAHLTESLLVVEERTLRAIARMAQVMPTERGGS
jgi:DNA-binding GntR family transcriptional regulator